MNALVEEGLIRALYDASAAGAKIDLVVRGACALRPGVRGVSENIRVRSILGRFLEHHRVWYFGNGGDPEVWLSSADWMGRNLFKRIEVAFPVRDPLRRRVIDEGWSLSRDNTDAWNLQADGDWSKSVRARALGSVRRRRSCSNDGADTRHHAQRHEARGRVAGSRATPATEALMDLILWRHAEAEPE
jgi:polyphosphate kinase